MAAIKPMLPNKPRGDVDHEPHDFLTVFNAG
jgi:hypothetical protein